MNETNPWLEITKQKGKGIWHQIVEQKDYGELKERYFHSELLAHYLTQVPLTPNECYDPDDLEFAEQFIMDVQCLTQGQLTDKYFDYWSAEEIEKILDWFVGRNSMPLPHELVDFLYDKGYWN